MRAKRGLKPMATPTGMVHRAPMRSAAITRPNVAAAPSRIWRKSLAFSWVNMPMARTIA
jgi:hypothetical protein